MTIRYLFHSGLSIECDDCTIIIDYFLDDCEGARTAQNGVVDDDLLKRPGKFYVLSSHSHGDHFNPVVLSWQQKRPDIQYILSRDIQTVGKAPQADNIHFLSAGETYSDDCLSVDAFGSTDLGVSFVIRACGKVIFHAGDLNNWHWKEEASADFANAAEKAYLMELNKIAQAAAHMDVAMFPVDPRLGPDCGRGAEQLMESIDVDVLIPIHFSMDDQQPLRYQSAHPDQNVVALIQRGATFDL